MTDNEKLDLILSKLEKITSSENDLQEKITSLENNMQEKIASLENDLQELKQRTKSIENNVTDIKLTLENEIRVYMKHMAEGHLDFSRKLNECIRLSSDIKDKQELQDIYINMHNNKLKAL